MKKFIDPRPIPNGGLPLFGGDFVECLQTEVYRAIMAQYKRFNEPLIIYGCQVTADLEAEIDFQSKIEYLEDLLQSGALTTGDLLETIKNQQLEITALRKENMFIKSRLTKAAQQGFKL